MRKENFGTKAGVHLIEDVCLIWGLLKTEHSHFCPNKNCPKRFAHNVPYIFFTTVFSLHLYYIALLHGYNSTCALIGC